jgi:hypothetical protein
MFLQKNRATVIPCPVWGGFLQHTVTKWLNPPVGPPKSAFGFFKPNYKKNPITESAKKVLDPPLNNRFLNSTSWLSEQWK